MKQWTHKTVHSQASIHESMFQLEKELLFCNPTYFVEKKAVNCGLLELIIAFI